MVNKLDTIYFRQFKLLIVMAAMSAFFLFFLSIFLFPESYTNSYGRQPFALRVLTSNDGRYILTLPLTIIGLVGIFLAGRRTLGNEVAIRMNPKGLEIANIYKRQHLAWRELGGVSMETITYGSVTAYYLNFWIRETHSTEKRKFRIPIDMIDLKLAQIDPFLDRIDGYRNQSLEQIVTKT